VSVDAHRKSSVRIVKLPSDLDTMLLQCSGLQLLESDSKDTWWIFSKWCVQG
jgi:hypothetical protein